MDNSKQKKISIAMCANNLDVTGISTVIMNYCCNMDREQFGISILAGEPITESYRMQCEERGIRVIELPARKKESMKYYRALNKALGQKHYDIVHVHGNSATITPELLLAYFHGIKIRIAHSHSTCCKNIKIHKLLLPIFERVCNCRLACSNEAGKWLFGEKEFFVMPNGFQTKRFVFNPEVRECERKKMGIENKFVIGHIGRFNSPKNQLFLLEIFETVAKQREDAYLLLVGEGPDFTKISKVVEQHPFRERICLYGNTDFPEKIYNALDVFVFPSKHEGLGIALLEAQMNGLPCISSDVVPAEVVISENIKCLSLSEGVDKWAKAVLSTYDINRSEVYMKYAKEISQYDINENVLFLEKLYQKLKRNVIV